MAVNPIDLFTPKPRFSWKFGAYPGFRQKAYRIAVAEFQRKAERGAYDLWDSGFVARAGTLRSNTGEGNSVPDRRVSGNALPKTSGENARKAKSPLSRSRCCPLKTGRDRGSRLPIIFRDARSTGAVPLSYRRRRSAVHAHTFAASAITSCISTAQRSGSLC